jgi:hypothetical protein
MEPVDRVERIRGRANLVRRKVALFLHGARGQSGAFSSNSRVGLRKALKKVLAAVEAKSFNAVEIAEIRTRGFLGWNYIQVVAYARHVNNTPFLPEFDPHYLPGTSGTSSRSIEEGPRSAQATRASKRRDGRS